MNKLTIIAVDTAKRLMTTKYWLIMLVLPLIVMGGFAVYRNSDLSEGKKLAVFSKNKMLSSYFEITSPDDFVQIDKKSDWSKKGLAGVISIEEKGKSPVLSFVYDGQDKMSEMAKMQVTTLANNLQKQVNLTHLGLSDDAKQQAMVTPKLTLNKDKGDDQEQVLMLISMFVIVLFAFFVQMYATIFATDMASDKAGKSMDIYLTSVSSKTLFSGKFLGLLASVLVNLAVFVVASRIIYSSLPRADRQELTHTFDQLFKQTDQSTLILCGLIAVVSFIGFALLSAVFGARAKDMVAASRASNVVVIALLILYGLSYGMVSGGMTSWFGYLVYLPFSSLFFLATVIGEGAIQNWQLWLIVIENLVLVMVMTKVVSNTYLKTYRG